MKKEFVLSEKEYRDKVFGGWLGKNIGGTLGMPFEGDLGLHALRFYEPVPQEPVGNDDLDLQLVWLNTLLEKGVGINEHDMRESWLDHVKNPFQDEYNKCYTNMKKGLLPPVCGWYNNAFYNCMGAPIRSEIWAMICPGCPSRAAAYAYNDAILDHKDEGVHGEVFLAALESSAFCENDINSLLNIGAAFVPAGSAVRKAVDCVRKNHGNGVGWKRVREILVKEFNTKNACFAPINIGFMTIGLLYGDDFGSKLCTAVNCGYDTDCTAATVGSILGIINGTGGIPAEWKKPVGTKIKISLNLTGFKIPKTLAKLTEDTVKIGYRVLAGLNPTDHFVKLKGREIIFRKSGLRSFSGSDFYERKNDVVTIPFAGGSLAFEYNGQPTIGHGEKKVMDVVINLPKERGISEGLSIAAPRGWEVEILENNGKPKGSYRIEIETGSDSRVGNINTLGLAFKASNRKRCVDITLLGKAVWFVSAPRGISSEEDFGTVFNEEEDLGLRLENKGVSLLQLDDESLTPFFGDRKKCLLYAQTSIFFPEGRKVKVFVDCNDAATLWFEGKKVLSIHKHDEPIPAAHYMRTPGAIITVKKGWNRFFLKLLNNRDNYKGYFFLAEPPDSYMGFTDIRYDALERETSLFKYGGAKNQPREAAEGN